MISRLSALFLIIVITSGCISEGESQINTNLDPVCGTDGRTYANPYHAEKENVTVAQTGVCKVIGCNDSDLGYNIDTVGTVTTRGEEKMDYCINSSTLNEYECRYGDIFSSKVKCPSGKCENGECLSCIDSDGADIFTYGEIRNFDTPYDINILKDECRQIDSTINCTEFYRDSASPSGYSWKTAECSNELLLEEFRCDNDHPFAYFIKCPEGLQCYQGRCAPMGG